MGEEYKEVISRTVVEKPNSYEFGKAGNRFKLYFNEPADLKKQMKELQELGYYIDELQGGTE